MNAHAEMSAESLFSSLLPYFVMPQTVSARLIKNCVDIGSSAVTMARIILVSSPSHCPERMAAESSVRSSSLAKR